MPTTSNRDIAPATAGARPFAAVVERPAGHTVRSHTLQVARFTGWIASCKARSAFVRVRVGDAEPYDEPASAMRPDVIEALGSNTGLERAFGFDFYVDLPPGLTEPLPVVLEPSDGVSAVQLHPYLIHPEIDLSCLETFVGDPPILREMAHRHLTGVGLEFGALHAPVGVDRRVTRVEYADRLTKSASLELYPEMRDAFGAAMVDVDHIVDLDHSDLSEFEPLCFDFFVANGVIEHLANPLRFLENIHRLMKSGARFLLSVPDRDFAFDTRRALTANQHLLADYEGRISVVSDAHIADALRATLTTPLPDDSAQRSALFAFHRERSIHVHVWSQSSFDGFLECARQHLSLRFRLVERATSRQALGSSIYVLEKVA